MREETFAAEKEWESCVFCSFREETLSAAKDWVGKLRASNSSTIPGVLLAAKVKRFNTESKNFKRIAKKRY